MEKPTTGISVDGSCEGNPGRGEYKGIDIETGKILFQQKFTYTTNNIMEFCALVHGIKWNIENNNFCEIYSDSFTAISWVKNKSLKTELPKDERTVIMWKFIKNCLEFLIKYQHVIKVSKWDTKNWGENPADFGKKQNNFIPAKKIKYWIQCNPEKSINDLAKYFNL